MKNPMDMMKDKMLEGFGLSAANIEQGKKMAQEYIARFDKLTQDVEAIKTMLQCLIEDDDAPAPPTP